MDSVIVPNHPEFSMISPDEPPVFELTREDVLSPIMILCDHARNRIPMALTQVSIDPTLLSRHIAYDIGAEWVTHYLADSFNCAAIVSGYSRLVIDLNRHPGDGSSIPERSDDIEIAFNLNLSPDMLILRENTFFWPYHNKVTEQLNRINTRGQQPVIISIHSFTPEFKGFIRPWHIGVLWDQDRRIAKPLIERLREKEPSLSVGDNEPYHARNPLGFTMDVHCERNEFPHVLLEIRQDLIDTPEQAKEWAELLHRHLHAIFTDMELL